MASIGIFYIGLPRFEEMGKKNHQALIDRLKQDNEIVVYDFLQPKLDRSTCPFPPNDTGGARLQVWDFYTALDAIKETYVLKIRSDIWFSKSAIETTAKEVTRIVNGESDVSFMGCETRYFYNQTAHCRPVGKNKIIEVAIIANKNKIKPKDIALKELQIGKLANLKSGNSTFKVLKMPGSAAFEINCHIYTIRKDLENATDWQVGWDFLNYYTPDSVVDATNWWLANQDKEWL